MQALVFRRQICDLLAELLRLRIILLQLLLDLVQKTVYVLRAVAAEVFSNCTERTSCGVSIILSSNCFQY